MSFKPDELTVKQLELSPNARVVFEAHCRYRIHKYRVSFATNQEIADVYGLSLGSVRNAMTELRAKGWLRSVGHWTEFLLGDFSPVDKQHPRKEIPAGPLFGRAVEDERRPVTVTDHETMIPAHETMIENHETVISDHETMSADHETMSFDHETMIENHETVIAHNKDHARVSSLTSQPAHTPATPAPPPAAEEKTCVRVCPFSLHELKRYAKANGLGGGWISDVLNKTGKFDVQIADWLKPAHGGEGAPVLLDPKQCPDCGGTNYNYPRG